MNPSQIYLHHPAQPLPNNPTFTTTTTTPFPVTPRKRTHDDDSDRSPVPQLLLAAPKSGGPSEPPTDSQYVTLKIMPRELMYTLTYLLSLAVHFDGHGKSSAFPLSPPRSAYSPLLSLFRPKSLIYAQEGLKQVDRQLSLGFQGLTPHRSGSAYAPSLLASMHQHLGLLMQIKSEINILCVQIAIVRSDFLHADRVSPLFFITEHPASSV